MTYCALVKPCWCWLLHIKQGKPISKLVLRLSFQLVFRTSKGKLHTSTPHFSSHVCSRNSRYTDYNGSVCVHHFSSYWRDVRQTVFYLLIELKASHTQEIPLRSVLSSLPIQYSTLFYQSIFTTKFWSFVQLRYTLRCCLFCFGM